MKGVSKGIKIHSKEIGTEGLASFNLNERCLESNFKGSIYRDHIPSEVNLDLEDKLTIKISSQNKKMFGTALSLLRNRIQGFQNPFVKELEVQGKGYSATLKDGQGILFKVGYSHDVNIELDPLVSIKIFGGRRIILSSCDKRLLGQSAAEIVRIKKPSPYFPCGIYIKGKHHLVKKAKK